MNLKEIIPNIESETLEFKTSLGESREIIETISGFQIPLPLQSSASQKTKIVLIATIFGFFVAIFLAFIS